MLTYDSSEGSAPTTPGNAPVSLSQLTNETPPRVTINSKFGDIKFPSSVAASPYTGKVFASETPFTRGMEMNNWLKEQVFQGKNNKSRLHFVS
jgi:hypothetical protein